MKPKGDRIDMISPWYKSEFSQSRHNWSYRGRFLWPAFIAPILGLHTKVIRRLVTLQVFARLHMTRLSGVGQARFNLTR